MFIRPLQDGGPVELTTHDMPDDELSSYLRTEDEITAIASHDPSNAQGEKCTYCIPVIPYFKEMLQSDNLDITGTQH